MCSISCSFSRTNASFDSLCSDLRPNQASVSPTSSVSCIVSGFVSASDFRFKLRFFQQKMIHRVDSLMYT